MEIRNLCSSVKKPSRKKKKKSQAKMGLEPMNCEIVLHSALPSGLQMQTQFCTPY